MKIIKINDLIPGMSFTKSIYLDKDTIFASPNTIIKSSDIEKLKKFGVTEIMTNGDQIDPQHNTGITEDIPDSKEVILQTGDFNEEQSYLKDIYQELNKNKNEFNQLLDETIKLIRTVYTNIADDKNIDINKTRVLIEKLVDHIKVNPNFSYLLLSVPVTDYFLYNQVAFAILYSLLIGYYLEYSRPKLIDLGIASFFADIGMTKIPPKITEKTTKLSDDEFKIFIKHPLVGYQLLSQKIKLKYSLAVVALQHHENFNGTGYPQKLTGKNIDELSRIYTVADNFSAMINNRPWRKKSLPYEVMKNMISTDVNKFDLSIIKLFLSKLSMYPVGSYVELSDSRIGIIIYSNAEKPLRPAIRITHDASGSKINKLLFVDLVKENHLFITKALDSHSFN